MLGVQARKENPSSLATAGFVCSIIGVVLCCLLLACAFCALGTLGAIASNLA